MWYDLFILGVLVFFTISGAARGVVWQIAGIAGILLCFAFADGISAAFGPYVQLQPPLNHWVVLFGAYLFFSFLSFGIARMLNEWIEKAEMKEFNRHLGAAFGLLKGVILSLIITFLVVTVSADARESLKQSRSGYYAAHIMNRLHPIMPEKLHDALAKYIHLLDHDGLGLPPTTHHDHDHGETTPLGTTTPMLGEATPNPFGTNTSSPVFGQTGTSSNQNAPPITIESFFNEVRGKLSSQAKSVVQAAFQNQINAQSPQAQQQIEQLKQIIQQTPTSDLGTLQHELVSAGANHLDQFIASKLGTGAITPVPADNGLPQNQNPTNPASTPNSNPWINTPPVADNTDAVLLQIAKQYSNFPAAQQGIAAQFKGLLNELPAGVTQTVLADWQADLFAPQTDPNPQTNRNSPLEIRVLAAAQRSGLTLAHLSPQWQQRIRAVLANTPTQGSAL